MTSSKPFIQDPAVASTRLAFDRLLLAGESQTLEFKASFDKATVETLVRIKAATSPSIIPDLLAHEINGKTIVAIDVSEFPVKLVSTKGRYYKRVANTNRALNPNQIADLYIQQGQPTWAAMLLFAREPLRHHIHIGRFKTPDMIIDDCQITDTLFEVVEQAMKFIISYIAVAVAFEFDGSIHRKERFAYPLSALREALLNAVVHRDYTDGSDIQAIIFDKQITIFSPGTFYGKLTVADVQADNYRSSMRNKLIAEGFYLTHAIVKYGSGSIRIRKALLEYPKVEFAVEEKFGGVMATFTQSQSQPESQPESSLSLEARVLGLLASGPIGKRENSATLGQKEVSGQLNKVIRALLATGLITVTLPHKPSSRLQQYRLKSLE